MKKRLDRIANIASAIMMLVTTIWLFMLPERVPIHFDVALRPDDYGNKWILLLLLILPLFGFIPYNTEQKEIHGDDPELVEALKIQNQQALLRSGVKHLIGSVVMAGVLLVLLIAITINC